MVYFAFALLNFTCTLYAGEEPTFGVHESKCSAMGITDIPFALEDLDSFSITFKETVSCVVVLAGNRYFRSQSLSVVAQFVFIVVIIGTD